MTSRLHPSFRRHFARLPNDIQQRARDAYRRFQANRMHPGLQFKSVHPKLPIWSVRINDSYRALAVMNETGDLVWFFIGTHAEYDRMLQSL